MHDALEVGFGSGAGGQCGVGRGLGNVRLGLVGMAEACRRQRAYVFGACRLVGVLLHYGVCLFVAVGAKGEHRAVNVGEGAQQLVGLGYLALARLEQSEVVARLGQVNVAQQFDGLLVVAFIYIGGRKGVEHVGV